MGMAETDGGVRDQSFCLHLSGKLRQGWAAA
jgi:hypothetical protein